MPQRPVPGLVLAALISLSAPVLADGTPADAGLLSLDWRLTSLDGQTVASPVTLRLDEGGELAGQGPCNRYFGALTLALPVFRAGDIGATRMACPDMAVEARYFTALGAVDQAALQDDRLVLTGGGHELVYARPAD